MEAEKLKKRHKFTDALLNKISNKVFDKLDKPPYLICKEIGEKFGIVSATVSSYCAGRGKDGYLKESILEEFKKLQ